MTDDKELIARLRKADEYEPLGHDGWEAADRIDALIAENAKLHDHIEGVAKDTHKIMVGYEAKLAECEKYRDAYAECDRIGTQAVRDLEAKLAKAVEALDMLSDYENLDKSGGYYDGECRIFSYQARQRYGDFDDIARTALAEIKGESHE